MNDKTAMEAAREAALTERLKYDPRTDKFDYQLGFEDGWNARQSKPCVWTAKECKCCWVTQCGKNGVRWKRDKYCSNCGGKIEDKPADSGDDIFISPIRNAIPVTVRASLQKKGR